MEVSKRVPMARKEVGSKGEPRQLLANHFGVCLVKPKDDIDGYFYHYDVCFLIYFVTSLVCTHACEVYPY